MSLWSRFIGLFGSNLNDSLQRVYALTKKELIATFMDKGTRTVLVLPIIIQSLIFGYAADYTLTKVDYALFDDSRSALSREFIFDLVGGERFVEKKTCRDLPCLRETLANGEVLVGLYIPKDFAKTGRAHIIADARNTASANTAASYIASVASGVSLNLSDQTRKVRLSNLNPQDPVLAPISLSARYLFNENNITRFTIMTGMILTLSMIQVMMLAGFSVAREREEGSFDMMLMTPTTPFEMLIGKAAVPIFVAFAQGLALALICMFYFGIPLRGTFLELSALVLIFSACVVGVGLAMRAVCKTSTQAIVWSFTIILPCTLLSGLLTPADAMPAWFAPLAYLDPLYYANRCVWAVYLEGQSLMQLWGWLIPLIAIGAGCMMVAVRLFSSRLD